MKLSEHVKICPADIPVASVPFRDGVLDIFAPTAADLCWLLSKSQNISAALEAEGSDRIAALVSSVSAAAPEVIEHMLCVATGEEAEILRSAKLKLGEQVEILTAFFENGVPDTLRGKILAAVARWLEATAAKVEG
jgi:hypothetical protein